MFHLRDPCFLSEFYAVEKQIHKNILKSVTENAKINIIITLGIFTIGTKVERYHSKFISKLCQYLHIHIKLKLNMLYKRLLFLYDKN